ncbi:hypothetical protein SDC9_56738 [bioreactor metagenome]|uniref:Uncharacterized protein n=1 Tax=bioreactor metagenome TaxID=1076179 RepID=A0A644X2Q7_9ZZZZ
MDKKTVAHELAKKYTFENFDFKNGSPEQLLESYQKNEDIISTILDEQSSKAASESLDKWFNR